MEYYYYEDEMDPYDVSATEGLDYDMFSEEEGSLNSVLRCVQPSVVQVLDHVLALIGLSLACKIVWTLTRRWLCGRYEFWNHACAIFCGCMSLYVTTGHLFLIVLFLSLAMYSVILVIQYHDPGCHGMGNIVAVIVICSHFVYEALWHTPESWQRIRGIQMVASMKIISLAFDVESFKTTKNYALTAGSQPPPLIAYLGYIFSPSTCLLGPWLPFDEYLRISRAPFIGARAFIWSMLQILLALIFLGLSNCAAPLICSNRGWKWGRAYRDAFSIRTSHYFICFLSQAALTITGASLGKSDTIPGPLLSRPLAVEFPRSLSALVRVWNTATHHWLKTYVFRKAHLRLGNYFAAIVLTYFVSALLHGFHIGVYLVLISLGLFAYAESTLRSKLALVFDACITANGCVQPCMFTHCYSHGWMRFGTYVVVLANLFFSLLTIVQLAYLGVMMQNTVEDDSSDFPASWDLQKWSHLEYFGHWMALLAYTLSLLI